MTAKIEIKGVPSKSEDVFFFTASIPLIEGLTAHSNSSEDAMGSPLFMKLFEFPWVESTSAEGRALIVKKKKSYNWKECAPQVAEVIRNLHEKNINFFSPEFLEKTRIKKAEEDKARDSLPVEVNLENINTPLGKDIQKVLKEEISPSLASHGGYARIVDLIDGEVHLYFGGGCQGCSQASVTVKQGIERILLSRFSELKKVKDVTDHSLGKNPFYK